MKNLLFSLVVMTAGLYAENFEQFLDKAIERSPYLKSSSLGIEQVKEKGSALMRYENPSLKLEYSRFKPDIGDSDNGYRVNYSQPIRLWGVGNDKEHFANASVENAKAVYSQKKAEFIRDISLSYTLYAQQTMFLALGAEELRIAETIFNISKTRYENGTVSRGTMLQAQVAFEMIQARNESLGLNAMQGYYNLLKQAGISEEIALDTHYDFSRTETLETTRNPDLLRLESQEKRALSEAAVNSNKIEWMRLSAEYENEPQQDIARVGLNVPLAFFNTKSQEKAISRLEAQKSELLLQNEKARLNIETIKFQKEMTSLKSLKSKNEKILQTELELLTMFKEGYKIANINLLELQDIKNKVIETKGHLIQIKTGLDQNAIYANYMQGNYNE
ncbi:MAG: TolC family protein [Helicobacteraceae bacterium]|jgi:cobalt-zinc-cadmium efflux system outer membrane protein|nr:TolC family protein [Helicobacteraceae bacterium]